MVQLSENALKFLEEKGFREGDDIAGLGTIDPTGEFVPKNAPKPVSVVSSENGVTAKQEADKKMASLTVVPPAVQKPTEAKPQTQSSVTLINENGQEITFQNPDINRQNIEGYLGAGYSLASAQGEIPSWFTPQTGTTQVNQVDTEIDQAKADFQTAQNQLKNLNTELANDPELQGILTGISASWDSRIQQMERANASRKASVTNLGFRVGSQYGGGGFEGIISAEESAGISRVGELLAQKSAAITNARSAYRQNKWDEYYKQAELAEKAYDNAVQAVQDLNKAKIDQDKALVEREKAQREEDKYYQEKAEKESEDLSVLIAFDPEFDLNNKDTVRDIEALADLHGIDRNDLLARITTNKKKQEKEALDSIKGVYGEYASAVNAGLFKGTFDQFYAKTHPQTGAGEGGGTGSIERDVESVMSGALNLQDISTKGNYRAQVASGLKERASEALKSGDIYGVMKASAVYDKEPSDTFLTSMEKVLTVANQLNTLEANIKGEKTGPIVGAFREKNPWDTKAQTIKAQLNSIVPNLARGVYGEVGVLTDNDIKVYAKTIPNLTSTEDIRNAILYITVDMIKKNVETKIKNQASGQRDMSGYAETYKDLESLTTDILSRLPSSSAPNGAKNTPKKVTIQDKEYNEGDIVVTKSGKRGRINADGTITPQ